MAKNLTRVQHELISVRDTIESIWVAIILAFILRAFMVEAFVIPTGSMAPRLMGQHFQLQCDCCGWEYAFTTPTRQQPGSPPVLEASQRVSIRGSRCPNCGKTYDGPRHYVNSGDRVLVMKFLYNVSPPRPWDVVVFRNPQENDQNYIKRLIGLPGETIELVQGDVFVKKTPDQPYFEIRRKDDPRIQEAMWQVIYDNDYRPDGRPRGRDESPPPQWTPQAPDQKWDLNFDGGRHFQFAGSDAGDWRALRFAAPKPRPAPGGPEDPPEADPRDYTRELFLPNYGYNEFLGYAGGGEELTRLQYRDVCSDLKLSVRFVPRSAHSRLALTLTNFDNAFQAVLSADGSVRLMHGQMPARGVLPREWQELRPAAQLNRPLVIGRGCQVALTHTDYRVTVWIDGKSVLQTDEKDYTARLEHQGELARLYVTAKGQTRKVLEAANFTSVGAMTVPTPVVQIAASAGPCRLEHICLYRDVYYTGHRLANSGKIAPCAMDYAENHNQKTDEKHKVRVGDLGWGVLGNPITLQKDVKASADAPAGDPDLDSFFVLGDNSPCSLDSRAWIEAALTLRLHERGDTDGNKAGLYQFGTVPRYNMIGKALFVYWPAGHRLPGVPRLPIVPNVGRMRLVR